MNVPVSLGSLAERLAGVGDVECVTPDLNGIPRGKVMTGEGFLADRRLQLARGVLLQCVMGGYPEAQYYGSDDGDLVLRPLLDQVHVLPWIERPRALAICEAVELDGQLSGLSTRALLSRIVERYAERGWAPVVATELEFFLFEPNRDDTQPFQPPVGLVAAAKPVTARSVSAPAAASSRSSTSWPTPWPRWAFLAIPLCTRWASASTRSILSMVIRC